MRTFIKPCFITQGRNGSTLKTWSESIRANVASCSVSSVSSFLSMAQSTRSIDLRSDTVTMPSSKMMQAARTARLGDDVYGEDPTVVELETYAADLFGKDKGLYVPTGTMANLLAILSHCHTRASEIIIGSSSHIALWEGGGAANLGGVHTIQIQEDPVDATMSSDEIRDNIKWDNDDHWPETKMLCLENTHNMLGGVALSPSYMSDMGQLAAELRIRCHVDGARIFNAAVAHNISVSELCQTADSVSVCCSKGLGAPLGSVLVGDAEFIRLARRARKRCGGGMRQAGVVAAMGLYALLHNVTRLEEDHARAKRIGNELMQHGFYLPRNGQIDTNVVYFGLPDDCLCPKEELGRRLEEEYGVRVTGGYSKGGELFRIVTHMDLKDGDIDQAIEAIKSTCLQKSRR